MFKAPDHIIDEKMPRNILGYNPTWRKYFKDQKRLHFWFKYVFLVIVIKSLKFFLRKQLREIPKHRAYENYRVFKKAREASLHVWCDLVVCRTTLNKENHEQAIKKFMKSSSVELVRDLSDIFMVYTLHDNAYFNLFNILMFNIALEMNKHHKSKAGHVIFASEVIDDVRYFTVVGNQDQFDLYNCEILRFKMK